MQFIGDLGASMALGGAGLAVAGCEVTAIDYADAIARYYGGKQKAMAERLEVSQPWLSRYLALASLPAQIVGAFPSIRDLKERHARDLKPLLARPVTADPVLAQAAKIEVQQQSARNGRGPFVDPADVVKQLRQVAEPPKVKPAPAPGQTPAAWCCAMQ